MRERALWERPFCSPDAQNSRLRNRVDPERYVVAERMLPAIGCGKAICHQL